MSYGAIHKLHYTIFNIFWLPKYPPTVVLWQSFYQYTVHNIKVGKSYIFADGPPIHINVRLKFLNNPNYETVNLFHTIFPISLSVASSEIVTFPNESIQGKDSICFTTSNIRMHQWGLRQSHFKELNHA